MPEERTHYYMYWVYDSLGVGTVSGGEELYRTSADMLEQVKAVLRIRGDIHREQAYLEGLDDRWNAVLENGGDTFEDEVPGSFTLKLRRIRVRDVTLIEAEVKARKLLSHLAVTVEELHLVYAAEPRLEEVLELGAEVPMSLDEWDLAMKRWRKS